MNVRRLILFALVLPLPVVAALLFLMQQASESRADRRAAHGETTSAEWSPEALTRGQAIASLNLHPATLVGGEACTVTVTLRYPARPGGGVVNVSAEGGPATHSPKSITIPAGSTSASFKVETAAVARLTPLRLTVTHEGKIEEDTLTLMPRPRREWYAAPEGRPEASGAKDSPWDLATALAGGTGGDKVEPGDTLWLRGGRYAGTFTSTLKGDAQAPVVVRAARGERAVIDRAGVGESKQPALKVRGPWVWFWGLEVTNSHPDRSRKSPYTGKDEPWRGSGADVYAPHVKFINCVFHDNGHGVWDKQDMTEVHGSLFYYNGNNKREHALYTGNGEGTKYVTDNVVFAQGGYGILAHSDSAKSAQRGLHIEGNVCFNNGAITGDDQATGNLQVGGVEGVPAERVVVRNNFVYAAPGAAASKSNGMRLGFEDKNNVDLKLLDNYVVARRPLRVWWWRQVECAGNTIIADGEACELLTPEGAETSRYLWDFNTYLLAGRGGASFVGDSKEYGFAGWRQKVRLDVNSRYIATPPAGAEAPRVFVRPNRYEAGRAHIVVFNRGARERVEVDLGGLLAKGQGFEIRDAQNFRGAPVSRGVYNGGPISLPLQPGEVARPAGRVERAPTHTAPEFAVFVLSLEGR
ncbi:MAG TPA: right-handed parallel beta-helix repeat-containing protein [Pyrinomonadaceae bacterium]|nr:right-handed parallel beta-helix repeat-containing protein [Pyrinomonadaceae bacterium]